MNLEQKMKELAKPLPKTHKREGGKAYWTIEEFRGRMDQVFGPSGYSMEYSMMAPYEFPVCRQVLLTCHCTIRIYDEGKVVYSTMGVGCKEVQRLSKTYYENNQRKERAEEERSYTELNNAAYSLQLSAFKNACKSMNIFGCNAEDSEGGGNSDILNQRVPANHSNYGNDDVENVYFYVVEAIKEVRKDKNTGKPVYEVGAYKMVGESTYDNKVKHTIVFYPNKYKGYEKEMESLIARKHPYRQHLVVKQGSQGGYVFCGGLSCERK